MRLGRKEEGQWGLAGLSQVGLIQEALGHWLSKG